MKTAGGIISIIGGIFGVFAAIVTLLVGGIGGAVEADGASTVVGLGWFGVLFSFATIVLGAVAMYAQGKKTGIALIICSVFGILFGGTLVAIFMLLSLTGGILSVIGVNSNRTSENESITLD
jgi:hypothetical protein